MRLQPRIARTRISGLWLGIVLLAVTASPGLAGEAPPPDEYAAHVQRAEQLMASNQLSEALSELDAASAIRQQPRLFYLQGLTRQRLGNNREAFLLFQRFVAESAGEGSAAERRDAGRRIVELRPRIGPNELLVQSISDEITASARQSKSALHIQRAEELLANDQPGEALMALGAAFAIDHQPRVLYLQGLARQALGNNREAFFLFQHFLASSGDKDGAGERRDAGRRIAELRRLIGPIAEEASAPGEYTTHIQRAEQLMASEGERETQRRS